MDHVEVVRFLLEAGADMDLASNVGFTARMMASVLREVEVVRLLKGCRCRQKPRRQGPLHRPDAGFCERRR